MPQCLCVDESENRSPIGLMHHAGNNFLSDKLQTPNSPKGLYLSLTRSTGYHMFGVSIVQPQVNDSI